MELVIWMVRKFSHDLSNYCLFLLFFSSFKPRVLDRRNEKDAFLSFSLGWRNYYSSTNPPDWNDSYFRNLEDGGMVTVCPLVFVFLMPDLPWMVL